jgi:hypothetical protein
MPKLKEVIRRPLVVDGTLPNDEIDSAFGPGTNSISQRAFESEASQR